MLRPGSGSPGPFSPEIMAQVRREGFLLQTVCQLESPDLARFLHIKSQANLCQQ
jgi:hypothetical protein